jgi:ribosome-associated protein
MPKNSANTQSFSVLTTPPAKLTDADTLELVRVIAQAADERKGSDIVLLRVAEVSTLADYFVIVSGFSKVQVRAITRSIEEKVEETLQRRPVRSEGMAEGTWVLLDYGDVVAHVLMPHEREFYNLEAFWGHAERLSIEALSPNGSFTGASR